MGDKAAAKKLMGEANVEYKAAKYDPAIEKYTKAIELDPKEPQYPTNRAMVYLKMKKWAEAEEDCTNALKLNNKYAKVYQIFWSEYNLWKFLIEELNKNKILFLFRLLTEEAKQD